MKTPARCGAARVDVALVCGGRWHDFDYARLRLLQWLDGHDSVRCSVFPDFSDIQAICATDAVIAYTCDIRPTADQALALDQAVHSGTRLLALHATNSAIDAPLAGQERVFRTPDAMPEFSALLGNRFLAHPKIASYRIAVADTAHPLVAGIDDFDTIDEIYVSEIADDLHVILDTEYDGQCPGFETQSVAGRRRHPVLFSRSHGDGHVLYFTLGHCRGRFDLSDIGIDDLQVIDRIAWDSPEFLAIMRRAVAWAVHGERWQDFDRSPGTDHQPSRSLHE